MTLPYPYPPVQFSNSSSVYPDEQHCLFIQCLLLQLLKYKNNQNNSNPQITSNKNTMTDAQNCPLKKPPPFADSVVSTFASVASVASIGVTESEFQTLSRGIAATHDSDVVNIACLVHLTQSAFRVYAAATHVDLEPVLELQRKYLRAYMSANNISKTAVLSAMTSLERASETIDYLDSLPA